MIARLLGEIRDFFQMFFNPEKVYERHRKVPQGLDAPPEDWSYRR